MPLKDTSLAASRDADLLKAVIKATGGVTAKGSSFWTEVAATMTEDVTSEAARKRFDKFKPSATPAKSSTPDKDADLLKAVIKVNGGVTAKGAAFWKDVAAFMDVNVSSEAARKRFDKFRVKGVGRGKGKGKEGDEGVGGEDEDGAVKKPAMKKAPAMPKAVKSGRNGKEAVGSEDNDGSDEDGAPASTEDEGRDKKVKKATNPPKQNAVKSEANVSKKRALEKALSDDETEEEDGPEQFAVETPASKGGRGTKGKMAAKKARVEDLDTEDEVY